MIRLVLRSALLLALCGAAACSSDDNGSGPMQGEELPDEVTVAVGKTGGTVSAKGIALQIPEGALDKTVMITAKNIGRSAPDSKRNKAISDVIEFGPAGTKFNRDVQITFSTDKIEGRASVHFSKEDAPDEFEKIPSEQKGQQEVTAKVRHFSRGYVAVDVDIGIDAGAVDASVGDDAAPDDDAGVLEDARVADDAELDAELDAEVTPPRTRITVNVRDQYGAAVNQTWAAFQDGDGPWQLMPPYTATGVYNFEVAAAHYAVTLVCADANNANSWNSIHYEPTATTTLNVVSMGPPCTAGVAPPSYSIQGTLSLGSVTYWRMGHGKQTGAGGYAGGSTTFNTGDFGANVANDLMFSVGATSDDAISRIYIDRTLTLNANRTGYNVNMTPTAATSFVRSGTALGQVTNANDAVLLQVRYTTRGASEGLMLNTTATAGVTTRSASFATLPEAQRVAADRYVLLGVENGNNSWRTVSLSSYASDYLTAALPNLFALTFSGLTTPYFRPVFSFPHQADASSYTFNATYSPTRPTAHKFTMHVNPASLVGTGAHQIAFPDLSQVTGFRMAWFAPVGAELAVDGAIKVQRNEAAAVYASESGQRSTLR